MEKSEKIVKRIKLSDIDIEKVAGGASSGGGFAIGCNDCSFTAHYDANAYEAASAAAAAHEKEFGHIVYLYYAE